MKLSCKALTEKTWGDFENLFGKNGACGGCWCMAWRIKPNIFKQKKGDGNKRAMKQLVKNGEHIGLIGYADKKPVAWCAFAPREKYIRLENSKVLAPIDEEKVWSVSCFFIAKEFRRSGLSTELLNAVIEFAKKKKVKILEAYPSVPYNNNIPAAFAWTGIPSSFEKAGFSEAARRSKSRPIMRIYL